MKHPSHCVRAVDTLINNDYAQQSKSEYTVCAIINKDYAQQSNIYRFCKHVCKIISQLHNNKEDEL